MLLSVCIPMYNESSIVEDTIEQLHTALEKTGIDYEVILSNDGSTDTTVSLAEGYISTHNYSSFKVISYTDNRGKGSAVREAVLVSRGDWIITTDCDLAFGTAVLGEVTSEFNSDTPVIIGSRTIHKDGFKDYTFFRKMVSHIYMLVLRIATGFKGSDSQCGFKAYQGEIGRKIFSLCECNGFAFDQEVLLIAKKKGYSIKEYPVCVVHHRESKVHVFRDTWRMLRDIYKIKKHIRTIY